MMNEKNWEDLFEAFKDETKFNEEGYADESDFENLNLYEWLGRRPLLPHVQRRAPLAKLLPHR